MGAELIQAMLLSLPSYPMSVKGQTWGNGNKPLNLGYHMFRSSATLAWKVKQMNKIAAIKNSMCIFLNSVCHWRQKVVARCCTVILILNHSANKVGGFRGYTLQTQIGSGWEIRARWPRDLLLPHFARSLAPVVKHGCKIAVLVGKVPMFGYQTAFRNGMGCWWAANGQHGWWTLLVGLPQTKEFPSVTNSWLELQGAAEASTSHH